MQRHLLDRRTFLFAPMGGLSLGACQTSSVQPQIVTFSYWFRSEPPLDASEASRGLKNGTRDLTSLVANAGKCAYLANFSGSSAFQLHLFGPTDAPPIAFELIGHNVSNASGENSCAASSQSGIDQNRLASGLELASPQNINIDTDFEPAASSIELNGVSVSAGFTLFRRARLTSFDQPTKYTAGRFEFMARPSSMPGKVVIVSGSFAMTGRYFTS